MLRAFSVVSVSFKESLDFLKTQLLLLLPYLRLLRLFLVLHVPALIVLARLVRGQERLVEKLLPLEPFKPWVVF